LFQLYEAAGSSKSLPWATVIAGVGAAVAAFIHRERQTTLVVGLIGGALALYALIGLRSDISDAEGFASLGIGPYIAVAGCAAMLVGALMFRPGTGTRTEDDASVRSPVQCISSNWLLSTKSRYFRASDPI
jgi:hypothetical protein